MIKLIKIIHGLVILAILGLSFYWFQLRPAQVRKECVKVANNQEGFNTEKFVAEQSGKTYFDETTYNKCLLEHGLKK